MMNDVSIVIPTYQREQVLVRTVGALLALEPPAIEVILVDQTLKHEPATTSALENWHRTSRVNWIRLSQPSIPHAMNVGLLAARGEIVLFLDDDIVPIEGLVGGHQSGYENEGVHAVVGMVLQPGEEPEDLGTIGSRTGLIADLDFPFRSTRPHFVKSAMAGNLSVKRSRAVEIGGFDENFVGSAYRFETEFARRVWARGGKVLFEPGAAIRHLRAARGGTRASGTHMTSWSATHGVGDYYFALQHGFTMESVRYIARRPFRETCTRFHLRRPWWIPVKLIGEAKALLLAVRLHRLGPKLLSSSNRSGL